MVSTENLLQMLTAATYIVAYVHADSAPVVKFATQPIDEPHSSALGHETGGFLWID